MCAKQKKDFFSAMGRCALALVFAASLGLFSVSAAEAQTAAAAACDDSFREVLEDNANAMRVRDRAVAGQLIRPPEPSAGMTCMDQAMGVTGRLGAIFSDVHNDMVPPANTVVFTPPLAYPDWGAGQFLVTQLSSAITPMMGNYMQNNFGGFIGAGLGASLLSSNFTSLIDGVFSQANNIGSQIAGFSQQVSGIMNAINTIQTLARALQLPLPSPVIIGAVAALEAAQRVADQLMSQLMRAMNMAVQPLIGQVMSEVMGPAAEIDCNNMAVLWSEGDEDRGIVPVQGGGPDMGAPFVSIAALAAGQVSHGGVGFMDQLQMGANMDILSRALNHLTEGALSQPGRMPSWKPAPSFSRTSSVQEVLQEMRARP